MMIILFFIFSLCCPRTYFVVQAGRGTRSMYRQTSLRLVNIKRLGKTTGCFKKYFFRYEKSTKREAKRKTDETQTKVHLLNISFWWRILLLLSLSLGNQAKLPTKMPAISHQYFLLWVIKKCHQEERRKRRNEKRVDFSVKKLCQQRKEEIVIIKGSLHCHPYSSICYILSTSWTAGQGKKSSVAIIIIKRRHQWRKSWRERRIRERREKGGGKTFDSCLSFLHWILLSRMCIRFEMEIPKFLSIHYILFVQHKKCTNRGRECVIEKHSSLFIPSDYHFIVLPGLMIIKNFLT